MNLKSKLLFWKDQEFSRYRPSVAALILSNAIPLIGVLLLGWRVFDVVYLYWLENVVIGFFNVLKIACCTGDIEASKSSATDQDASSELNPHALKLFIIPFFSVHYGLFCFVHGIFVVTLLSGDGLTSMGSPFAPAATALAEPWFLVALLGIVASHGISFVVNYIGKGEYKRYSVIVLMFMPYGRIIVLHVAIIVGAFLIMSLGSPLLLLMLVVIGKTWMDVSLHLVEHHRVDETSAVEN